MLKCLWKEQIKEQMYEEYFFLVVLGRVGNDQKQYVIVQPDDGSNS